MQKVTITPDPDIPDQDLTFITISTLTRTQIRSKKYIKAPTNATVPPGYFIIVFITIKTEIPLTDVIGCAEVNVGIPESIESYTIDSYPIA